MRLKPRFVKKRKMVTKNNFLKSKEGGVHPLLSRAQTTAALRGGFCLSMTFNKTTDKLLWKCHNESHQPWKALIYNVEKGTWCPECSGKLISTQYVQNSYLYEWKCKEESHPIWRASFSSVVSKKTWCKICGNKQSGLKRSKKMEPSNYLGHIIRK